MLYALARGPSAPQQAEESSLSEVLTDAETRAGPYKVRVKAFEGAAGLEVPPNTSRSLI